MADMKERSTVSDSPKTKVAPSREGVKGESPKKMADHYSSGDHVRPEHADRWGKATKYSGTPSGQKKMGRSTAK